MIKQGVISPKVLALDLDGTLTNASKEITPAVKSAIQAAAKKGVTIVLASGRPVIGMMHVADELELSRIGGYVLANNGSKIVDWGTGETIFESTLSRRAVEISCSAAHQFGVEALAYSDDCLVAESISAQYVEKERYNNSAIANEVPNLLEAITWEPNKMMVVGNPDELVPALDYLQDRLLGIADVFLSEPYFIEITPPGVRKDASLRMLLAKLGFSCEDMMACGDGLNDIPMLECAGLAIAMENAYDATKSCADWVAPSNEEDGVAVAICKFILESLD